MTTDSVDSLEDLAARVDEQFGAYRGEWVQTNFARRRHQLIWSTYTDRSCWWWLHRDRRAGEASDRRLDL